MRRHDEGTVPMTRMIAMMIAAGSIAGLGSASASAAPILGQTFAASAQAVQLVQYREGRRYRDRAPVAPAPRVRDRSGDNVGSIGYDGSPYGYNRFSGQQYQECMMDEGYGRARPCSSAGRP
ncbi:MAG: hypothetical protein IT538_12565 [Variibacter sp.]|nr:hypothetical protein [Variibacter sp.]